MPARSTSSRPRIAVVGSANTDMIIRLERLPRPGETLLGGEFATAAGGKGANQAVGAARAGGRVAFIARVGADDLGAAARAGLRRAGIDVRQVRSDRRRPSGVALIFVAREGENCIAVASGANHGLTPADVRRARPVLARADVLLLQLETPLATVVAAAAWAAAHGVRVMLNPAPAPAQALPAALLRHVAILTPNETEAERLTGIPVPDQEGAARAAVALRASGVATVIITLGARGAWLHTADGGQLVPGFTVPVVDTTAAGDVFNGALAVALGEGQALPAAVRFANAAAALSVTRLGAQPSAPTRAAIEKLLRRQRPA